MDQQSTDPNNPTPVQPVNPVPTPTVPAASMWGGQPDLSVNPPVPVTPTPVVEPVPTFTIPTTPIVPPSPIPTTPNFGENPISVPVPVPPASAEPDASSVPTWAPTSENSEAMPTDLSNLMGNTPPAVATTTEAAQPSVVIPTPSPETNQVVTSGSHGFPKIVLILGAVLILIAIGASAYFILGVGNSASLPASVPAEEKSLTNPPKQIVPTVAPVETATGSATLGNPVPTTVATNSAQPGSAIELLRSRITPTP